MNFLLHFFLSKISNLTGKIFVKLLSMHFRLYNANNSSLSAPRTKSTWSERSQHCWMQPGWNKAWMQHFARVWPPCCEVLRHVGCCCLKFENGQICCGRLAWFVQQCCTRACKLVRFSILTFRNTWQQGGQTHPTCSPCCSQQWFDRLQQFNATFIAAFLAQYLQVPAKRSQNVDAIWQRCWVQHVA